jgi:uncharacterized protein YciI
MAMDKKHPEEHLSDDGTEQYIKDVRKMDDTEDFKTAGPADEEEQQVNEAHQEENKKSQKDAEKDARYSDSSDPKHSKLK